MTDNKEKKYNLSVARAYTKTNGYWSVDLGAEEIEALKKVESGGRLVLQILRPESRKHDKSPEAYFQYMTPKEVQDYKTRIRLKNTQVSSDQDF